MDNIPINNDSIQDNKDYNEKIKTIVKAIMEYRKNNMD